MADTNIPVSERTLARLKELADWDGIAAGEALERAVNAQYDRKFWEAVDAQVSHPCYCGRNSTLCKSGGKRPVLPCL